MNGNGRLQPGENETLVGNVLTLTHNLRIILHPNPSYRASEPQSPKYEVHSLGKHGEARCGLAWEKTAESGPRPGSKFLTLTIDDPSFDRPLNVTAFPARSGDGFEIVWRRPRHRAEAEARESDRDYAT